MIFASDNWAGAAPEISRAMAEHASIADAAYANSALDEKVKAQLEDVFEHELAVYFVGTGTIANSLALSAYSKPGGITLCHSHAHILEDECGAVEFFTGGGRLQPVSGRSGKMSIDLLRSELKRLDEIFVHHGQPMSVSMTQATEAGTLYSLKEIQAISRAAKTVGVPLHMDGARFANALVSLDTTPADMTWKRGVDVLSFGATKNGCWCAEALIFFDKKMSAQVDYLHKRSGQLFSKSRFISSQLSAYLENDLWLDMARHSNKMAAQLREVFSNSPHSREAWKTQANEVFVVLSQTDAKKLLKKGAIFYDWLTPDELAGEVEEDESVYRFITSFATSQESIDQLDRCMKSL